MADKIRPSGRNVSRSSTQEYKTQWMRNWRLTHPDEDKAARRRQRDAERAKNFYRNRRGIYVPKLGHHYPHDFEETRPGYCKGCGIFLYGSQELTCGSEYCKQKVAKIAL